MPVVEQGVAAVSVVVDLARRVGQREVAVPGGGVGTSVEVADDVDGCGRPDVVLALDTGRLVGVRPVS